MPVTPGPQFEPGVGKPLFKHTIERTTATALGSRWAVTSDGQRFVRNASRASKGVPFSVVLDWPATLK